MKTFHVLVKGSETILREQYFEAEATDEEEARAIIQQRIEDEDIETGDLHEDNSSTTDLTIAEVYDAQEDVR